jgi:hypothetical protein
MDLTPEKYPKENIQVSEHGENLKSSILIAGARISCTPDITFIPLTLGLVNLVCKDALSSLT